MDRGARALDRDGRGVDVLALAQESNRDGRADGVGEASRPPTTSADPRRTSESLRYVERTSATFTLVLPMSMPSQVGMIARPSPYSIS